MTTERKTESGSSLPDISATGITCGVAPPAFTLRVTLRNEPAADTTGTRTDSVPSSAEARAEQALQPEPIAFVMADAPDDPQRPIRHGFLEHVFFDGDLELRLWWEADGPLHKAAIEL
jgi:hypothetical protein